MAIVMISSVSKKGRSQLASHLARKTGWPTLSREDLLEEAVARGIKVGRLEVSMIKAPGNKERLAREKQIYLAFITQLMCEKAREGNLIYHGRAGHLLLPGVSHRIRVGLLVPKEVMADEVRQALNLSTDKAWAYLDRVNEDIEKWFHFMHGVDPNERGQYDLVLNTEVLNLENAASLLCSMSELPDFKPTPVSSSLQNDMALAARARLLLALNQKTAGADLGIRADNGFLTVTYMPRQESVVEDIPRVLTGLEGCRGITCTMAETNILWVQEAFNPSAETFEQVNHLAQRWGAAVELLRVVPPGTPGCEEGPCSPVLEITSGPEGMRGRQSIAGVEDDAAVEPKEDGGLSLTLERLVSLGRSGGGHTVIGGQDRILEALRANGKQALVVIGDLFLAKDHLVRTRQTRELALAIQERVKAPVITAGELKARYLFGKRQAIKLVSFALLTAVIYLLVFSHQEPILDFLGGDLHQRITWLSPIVVALFIPGLAYIYGAFTGLVLKLLDID
ncbi:MAG: cytidylate kinase family protein [Thermodesulfobacteriota bacterium]